MLKAALRDLQWRWKRFVIAMVGVSLVFAMGLIMTGLTASFGIETSRTLNSIGAERWAVASDASGPFNSSSLISTSSGADSEGSPVMVLRETIKDGSKVRDVIMMGVEPGKLGAPRSSSGDDLSAAGQVVVDGSLPGANIDDTINIGGKDFHVVGETSGQSLFAGIPLVYVSLEDAQAIAVLGQPLATTLLFDHIPTFVPRELKVLSNADVKGDVLRPLTAARSSIGFVRLLLWLVAAIVIGSVLYLQALERTRDFAVFKATGTSTAAIGAGLALQAVMLSLAAAVLAAILATVLAPLFPLNIEIPTSAYLLLPVITVVVGLLACSIALRRTARVDPALAFGS